MSFLGEFVLGDEVLHGETRFYRAYEQGTGQQLYLMADPEALLPLPGHPGLPESRYVGTDEGFRWHEADIPTGPCLRDLWEAGGLDADDLGACLLQVVETLAHLASTRPTLLPDEIAPSRVRQLVDGRWVMDLAGLALTPGVRLGSGGSVIKALGHMLRQLLGDEATTTPAGTIAAHRKSSPAVRMIMMRCLWGGFASIEEVRQALTQLSARESGGGTESPVAPPSTQDAASPPKESEPPARIDPPVPHGCPPAARSGLLRGLLASAVFLGLLATVGLAVRFMTQPGKRLEAAPETAAAPVMLASASAPQASLATQPPAPETTLDDFLTEADLTRFARKPETLSPPPAPPPARIPVVRPPQPPQPAQPADPVDAADKATAGDNLVTVRLWGHPLGQVYMFTNPGAPVISLEALSRVLQRPIAGELTGPGQLRVADGSRHFDTASFVVLNGRVWLILKPELAAEFGIRIVRYSNGVMDVEPQSR